MIADDCEISVFSFVLSSSDIPCAPVSGCQHVTYLIAKCIGDISPRLEFDISRMWFQAAGSSSHLTVKCYV